MWNVNLNGGNGNVTIDASTMVVTGVSNSGFNNNSSPSVPTLASAFCPTAGEYSFDWSFAILNDDDGFDGGFYVNGELAFILSDVDGESGSVTVNCAAGDVIGFAVGTQDGFFGPGELTITNFQAPGTPGYEMTTLTRTFTADDGCGNTSTCDVTYTWATGIESCDADAGTLTADASTVLLIDGGTVTLTATPNGNAVVPSDDYSVVYVLTSGTELLIEDFNTVEPSFIVGELGLYTLHTLIIETSVLNSLELPDGATGFDVVTLIEASGICADLDAEGAQVLVQFDPTSILLRVEEEKIDFKAYPVPFNNEVTISYEFAYKTNVTIEVFDTKGLLIKTVVNDRYMAGTEGRTKLDLSDAPSQVLYVKLSTGKDSITKKIVSSGR